MPRNNPFRWMIISVIITIIGLMLFICGIFLNDMDYYWMILVGLLLLITFGICIVIFYKQSKRLNQMFNDMNIIAHWKFDGNDKFLKIESEFKRRKENNKSLMMIVSGLFIVITILFIVLGFDDFEEALYFGMLMTAILLVIITIAIISPYISYRRMKAAVPEVFISNSSVWIMGEYTSWVAPMTKVTAVYFHKNYNESIIEVHFEVYQRTGPQLHICRIPVPETKESEAQQVARQIAESNQVDCFYKGITD